MHLWERNEKPASRLAWAELEEVLEKETLVSMLNLQLEYPKLTDYNSLPNFFVKSNVFMYIILFISICPFDEFEFYSYNLDLFQEIFALCGILN